MTTTLHPLAEESLRELERTSHRMPRADRHELLAEIRSHLDNGLAADAREAEVRKVPQRDCTTTGPSPWTIAALVVVLAVPLLVATYLDLAAGRYSEATSG
jgi:hypothetical protein